MTLERVVIAGASGFIGSALTSALRAEGSSVSTIGRERGDALWRQPDRMRELVDGADLLINLAGRTVNCRHTIRNKKQILASRVFTTDALAHAVAAAAAPPKVWINASTTTYYRENWGDAFTEDDGEIGRGFTSNVAVAWEREFAAGARDHMRQVALRLGTVLGARGGALPVFARLARFGLGGAHLGGTVARGGQWISWVHIDDVVRAVRFIAEEERVVGPVNMVAPEQVTDRELMAAIRGAVHARFGAPAYRWMLELGAWALRTETELLLRSSRVAPGRLLELGFGFAHPRLDEALRHLIGKRADGHGRID